MMKYCKIRYVRYYKIYLTTPFLRLLYIFLISMYLLLVEDNFVGDAAVSGVIFSITYERNNGIYI